MEQGSAEELMLLFITQRIVELLRLPPAELRRRCGSASLRDSGVIGVRCDLYGAFHKV
jgi:hypothetical protein